MPAESQVIFFSRPSLKTSLRKTPSAVGDRQIFPKQTNKTRNALGSVMACAIIRSSNGDRGGLVKSSILILTGSGTSAESGPHTFRDDDGLWAKVRLEDVASPEAFARDSIGVYDF